MVLRFAAAILALLLPAASAFADGGRTNLEIFQAIQEDVYRYYAFTVFDDVKVAIADDGVVTLTGWVTEPYKKNEIGKRAARVDGVSKVENAIKVLRVSRIDDELRYRVAHAIYDHPRFQHYSRTSEPIHIVVERGHVTLTGVVDTEVEKNLAPWLARQLGVFSVTSELRTTAEARAELELLD